MTKPSRAGEPSGNLAAFFKALDARGGIAEKDRKAFEALPITYKTVPRGAPIVREGEVPTTCAILLSGYSIRYKLVRNGGRQIVALHLPGEALDFQSLHLECVDHHAETLTSAELAIIQMSDLRQMLDLRPGFAHLVVRHMLVEASIMREWLTNVGRRNAREKLAHLLCEFACRLRALGLGSSEYELPMTQEQLGDALGLTPVHINRSLRSLEADKLIVRSKRTISFPDIEALREIGDFNPLYLHIA